MNDDDLFELTYNETTGDFEYPHKTHDELEDRLDAIFQTPPQSMEEVLARVTDDMCKRYNAKKEKALRNIHECEDNGVILTREQKIQLFRKIINKK